MCPELEPLEVPLRASATVAAVKGKVAIAGLQQRRMESCWLAALEMQPSTAEEAPSPVSCGPQCCQLWDRVLCSHEKAGSSDRSLLLQVHRILGSSLVALAAANVFLGLHIARPDGYGAFVAGYAAFLGVMAFLIVLGTAFDFWRQRQQRRRQHLGPKPAMTKPEDGTAI